MKRHYSILSLALAALALAQRPCAKGADLSANPAIVAEMRSRILKLAELNTEQIRALKRTNTVVLMTGGILEQHGPYLPSYADGYANEWVAERLARAVVARPGWTALILPTIPLGVGGANEIGGKFSFPGTYAVRSTTLRAVFMDLASEFGEQGFLWIFIVHGHGAPMHNRTLDEVGDFFRDTYGGRMVHLFGLMPVFTAADNESAGKVEDVGLDPHAGFDETSVLLFLRPDLVAPGYRTAPSLPGNGMKELVPLARAPGWPGYLSVPSRATAARGRASMEASTRTAAEYMMRILDGADERAMPRYSAIMAESEANVEIDRAAGAHERVRENRFSTWLSRRQATDKLSEAKGIPSRGEGGADGATRETFLGTWRLVSWESTAEGQTNYPFGRDAKGLLLYTATGQMSVFLSRADRAVFARSAASAGTADEKVTAFDSCFAYAGQFEVAQGRVTHRLEHCTFPNWIGTAQLRFVRFDSDRLVLETPPLPSGDRQAVSQLVWEKDRR